MRLEDEIKSSKFNSPWHKAVVNIYYTNNFLKEKHLRLFKKYRINDQHFNILRILRGQHPAATSPSYIKEVLIDKRGDLTRLMDKLERMELITRRLNPDCRRMMDVSITDEGLKLLEEIDPMMEEIEKQHNHMTKDELSRLNDLLDKFRG